MRLCELILLSMLTEKVTRGAQEDLSAQEEVAISVHEDVAIGAQAR